MQKVLKMYYLIDSLEKSVVSYIKMKAISGNSLDLEYIRQLFLEAKLDMGRVELNRSRK